MRIKSILFVGRRNAARSLMAECCLNAVAIPGWRSFSAGWQPAAQADRKALAALADAGFSSDALTPKPLAIFRQAGAPHIDLCIFLDAVMPGEVASFPVARETWDVACPSRAGTGAAYREALEMVTARIAGLILSGRLAAVDDLPLAS